jgi:hypothetical protein
MLVIRIRQTEAAFERFPVLYQCVIECRRHLVDDVLRPRRSCLRTLASANELARFMELKFGQDRSRPQRAVEPLDR